MTTVLLLVALIVALLIVTALYVRRRLTHPFTKFELDGARAQSRLLSRTSRDGVRGENVAPWLPGFPYEPRDAGFLGKPVDYVVFDGLDDGELLQIVFVEIKSGKSSMTPRGQQIRRAIQEGRVTHQVVRLERAVDTAAAQARPRPAVSMPAPLPDRTLTP